MRRTLAILKYVPAVLCGLLVVAWVVSWWVMFQYRWPYTHTLALNAGILQVYDSSVSCRYDSMGHGESVQLGGKAEFIVTWHFDWLLLENLVGSLRAVREPYWGDIPTDYVSIPIPAFISLLLPVAVGCLNRFRFPLWSYFAWTALVAAELAYYLR